MYRAVVSREELQRDLIAGIADQIGGAGGAGVLAAFVDFAEEQGEESLRRLEEMIAERLGGEER